MKLWLYEDKNEDKGIYETTTDFHKKNSSHSLGAEGIGIAPFYIQWYLGIWMISF